MKDLAFTIGAGIVFLAFTYYLKDMFVQAPLWVAIFTYGVVAAGFIVSLLRFIKKL